MTRKLINVVLSLTLLVSLIGLTPTMIVQAATPQPETTAYPYATDHLIVKLRAEARVEKGTTSTHIASLDRALAEMNATALEAVPGLSATYLVKLDSKSTDILGAVEILNNDPAVEYAEPDYLAKFASAPDDPRYSEQWGLAKVQAEGAWDETMGSPSVVIAIIDSGIDLAHEDLAPNLWINPGEIPANSIDDDNNGFVDDVQGWNFVNGTNDVQDFIGHGSLVAGVAAARSNNTLGIAGMCGNCRIMPVKITQVSGFANYSDIAAGVNYAADKGAKVINLSVGGYADSITVKNAINAALSKGIVVVGGVGNDNKSDSFYPAAYEGVIAVAGTDESDVRVTSSNYGTWVDISAPGQNILSTTLGDYSSDTGTSYATPFVSGAAGLLLSLHPEWTPAMVRSQFLHTTDTIDSQNPGFEGKLGSGRLNAALATQPSHPILTYKTYAGNGTPELRPDFGSTVALTVTLYNDWADAAGVTGTLSSTDPYVTITTAEAAFGTILAGASQANSIPFSFDIAVGAGYNHTMPFTLALSANGGGYTTTLNFSITTRSSEEPVSGTIDVDTTWTNDKAYKVTGNVGVAPGYTLTIQPGTVVKFAGNYSLNLGGTLIAQGTSAQPIRFEPYTAGGTWNRIFFDNTSLDAVTTTEGVYQSGNILQYVTITGATGGIACTTATPFLDHVTTNQGGLTCNLGDTDLWLQDSTLTGIINITGGGSTPEHLARMNVNGNTTLPASQVSDSSFNGSLDILGNGQVNNITSGPLIINGTGDVQQATVTGSVSIATGQVLSTTLKGGSISAGVNSTISDCVLNGGGISAGADSTITHNNIENAPGNGITTSGNSTITFNRIVGAGQGIVAGAGVLENNLIANTTGDGLRPGTASVRNNTFIGIVGNGIYLDQVPTFFEYNNFEFNTGTYDVYVTVPKTTTINLLAQNNWWGTTDSNLIKARTWDYYDDYNLAKLITAPVLTAPSQTAPAYVRSVALNPASPVGIQTVDFTVEFSRPMDPLADSKVTFAPLAENTWTTKANMPQGSNGLGAATVNGKIFVIFGSSIIEYDPVTDTWMTKASMPGGRSLFGIATVNGKIFVIGGGDSSVGEYDPITDAWTIKATMPTPRYYLGAAAVNGKIYAIGGYISSTGGAASTVEEYDPATDTWTTKADMPTARAGVGVVATTDGKIYAIGGYPSSTVEEYDPVTDTWTTKSNAPSMLANRGVVEVNSKIYAIGGHPGVSTVEEYDPVTDTWTTKANMLTARYDLAVAVTNNKIYAFGGRDDTTQNYDLATVEEYTPPGWGELLVTNVPQWLDSTHYRVSYEFSTLNLRGDYRIKVKNFSDSDSMLILPDSGTIFTVDYAGEISDTTPPVAPLVSAWGNGSLTQLSAQATASDPDSEIVGYRYAIGTTRGGSDVVNWTNTPYTEITRTGLILQLDQAYYVSFQARNLGGLWSPIGVSNAVINGVVPNDPPVAVNDSYNTNEDVALTIAAPGVLVNDTDAESNPLTAIKVTDPAHGTLTLNANGSFTYTPTANWNGSDSFTYKANDGMSDSNVVTVTLTVTTANDAPVAINDNYTTSEDATLNVDAPGLLGNDTDVDSDSLTAIKVTDPAHGTVTLNANGSFTYTSDANWNGTDSFTYKANDGTADSNVATVILTVTAVNDPPVADNQSVRTLQDTPKAITLTASDVESSALTWTIVSNPAHGSLSGTAPNLTYTPSAGWTGSDSFTFKVNDGTVDSNTATISITVTQGNTPPVAVDDSYNIDEDTVLSIAAPGVLGNDTDADSDPLTAVLVTGPAHGMLTLNANGSFTYTPYANWYGTETFTYKANDGIEDSNVATVTISVADVSEMYYIYLPLIRR